MISNPYMSPLSIVALLFLAHNSDSSPQESGHRPPNEHHEDSQKVFDIVVHGILLWASMGFLIPAGILIMRISSCRSDFHASRHKTVFYVHAVLQVVSVLLVTVGAVLSIRNFENAFNNSHQRIGLALYASIYMQLMLGFKRPKRGGKGRTTWYFVHWILGTTTCLVGILNIYTGLQAYHKRSSRNTSVWTIIFTAQLSFMIILYLFQDKWDYITRQGNGINIDIGNHPNNPLSSSSQQVEDNMLNEACRKSNALGTHFSRTNALNKLFQLT